MTLLVMWTTYAVFGVIVYSAVFLWAVRTRQFSSEEQARRLPLECPAVASGDARETRSSWRVLAAPAVLLLLAAGAIAGVLICTYLR
jgi:nitrogen fixation-related uncharacterized protein